jgi:hypothetical protein
MLELVEHFTWLQVSESKWRWQLAQDYDWQTPLPLEIPSWLLARSPSRPSTCFAPYSYLSASIGSTEAARRAGSRQAKPATAISRTVTAPSRKGSRELSVTHFAAIESNRMLKTSPAANPAATWTSIAETTIRTTSRASAPTAIRIPNSFVLVATP